MAESSVPVKLIFVQSATHNRHGPLAVLKREKAQQGSTLESREAGGSLSTQGFPMTQRESRG